MSELKHLFHLRALPHAAMALAALGSAGSALAQTGNPVAGEVLYAQNVTSPTSVTAFNCGNCHGPAYIFRSGRLGGAGATEANVAARTASAIAADLGGDPALANDGMGRWAFLNPQQRADLAAFIATAVAPPPPPPFAGPPGSTPVVPVPPTASPDALMFNSTTVGSTSASVGILFTATTAVTFGSPAVSATAGDTTDFLNAAPPTGTTACPAAGGTLAAGMSCSIGAQFKPSAAGSRTATWRVNFANGVAPRSVTLSGTAIAAMPAPAPAAPAPVAGKASDDGGGGALNWLNLLGLIGLAACGTLRPRRRNAAWPHSDS